MDRKSPGRPVTCGVTLIELMISLAIVAVTLLVAAPSMQQLVHGNQVRTEASRLRAAINLARSEAVNRNSPVSLCPSAVAAGGAAVCTGTYTDGWMVFSNEDRDRRVDTGRDEVIRVFDGLPVGYTVSNRAGTRTATELITYLPDGSSRRNLTLLLCSPHGDRVTAWSVVINIVGRVRVARDWGHCPQA